MMSNADADADGGAGAGMIVPGPLVPPSPSKKEPRTDYDSPTLEISPNLEQAAGAVATRDEGFYYRGGC